MDNTKRSLFSSFGFLGSTFNSTKYKYVNTSAADKDPPGCPDLAACVDLMIPLRTSFAVFFNSAVVIVSTTLSYSPNTAL